MYGDTRPHPDWDPEQLPPERTTGQLGEFRPDGSAVIQRPAAGLGSSVLWLFASPRFTFSADGNFYRPVTSAPGKAAVVTPEKTLVNV